MKVPDMLLLKRLFSFDEHQRLQGDDAHLEPFMTSKTHDKIEETIHSISKFGI